MKFEAEKHRDGFVHSPGFKTKIWQSYDNRCFSGYPESHNNLIEFEMENKIGRHRNKFLYLESVLKVNRYRFLLFALIITMTVPPFLRESSFGDLSIMIVLSILLLACLNFLSGLKKIFVVALVIFFLTSIFGWLPYFFDKDYTKIIRCLFSFTFFSLVVYHLLKDIRYAEIVTSKVIYGSIAAYLLIGIIGGNIFYFLDLVYPGSFNIRMNTSMANFFSFTTLTTVGYGNVYPVKAQAQAISTFLAISGQLYLTVLVAILVGKYLSNPANNNEPHF